MLIKGYTEALKQIQLEYEKNEDINYPITVVVSVSILLRTASNAKKG